MSDYVESAVKLQRDLKNNEIKGIYKSNINLLNALIKDCDKEIQRDMWDVSYTKGKKYAYEFLRDSLVNDLEIFEEFTNEEENQID